MAALTPIPFALESRPGAVLAVHGEVDVATAPALTEALVSLIGQFPRTSVHVELGSVGFIDTTGLRALVDASRLARQAGGELVVLNPTRSTARLFEIVGLDRLVVVRTDVPEEAVSAA